MYSVFKEVPVFETVYTPQHVYQLWSDHDPECPCALFPISYNQLKSLQLDQQSKYVQHTLNILKQRDKQKIIAIKNYVRDRSIILTQYKPIHSQLFEATQWKEEWLSPSFVQMLNFIKTRQDTSNPYSNSPASSSSFSSSSSSASSFNFGDIPGLFQEFPNVYSFEMFSNYFCDILMEEIQNFEKSDFPKQRPNSMNNYGVILNNIGLEHLFDFFLDLVRPLTGILFPKKGGNSIDHHHSFVVEYKIGNDLNLDMHIDDSEITFNVNLFDQFTGAGLTFCGLYVELRKFSFFTFLGLVI